MTFALQIGQIAFFLLLFSATFIFIIGRKERSWLPGRIYKSIEDVRNDVRMIFERGIFKRLDVLNSHFEQTWRLNQYLLPAAEENERVYTTLYEDLYVRLNKGVEEWKTLGRKIAGIFQETDAFVQESNLLQLCMESVKVRLKRSRLDVAALHLEELKRVVHTCKDLHQDIDRIPVGIQKGLEELKKDIRKCLLTHIDVIETVKGERVEGHLRRLASILKDREVLADRVYEIINSPITKSEKVELSGMHLWLLQADEDIKTADQEFLNVSKTITDLSEMEDQVQAWHAMYGAVRGRDLFDGIIIEDLEKRVVALKELWEGYESEFKEFNEAGFIGRTDRIQFIVEEVERFDQDVSLVKTFRENVETHLKRLSEMGEVSNWMDKTTSLSPFRINFERIETSTNQYEKALIGWDNPRPYVDVQAFMDHAKRMEKEIDGFGDVFTSLKESYRLIKNIENFNNSLKKGLLKNKSSAVLQLYQYVNEETLTGLPDWKAFEEVIEHVELLRQDNPIAKACRHDPIAEDSIRALYKEVDLFRIEWEQALDAIGVHHGQLRHVLQKDAISMGNAWKDFALSIQTQDGRGVVFPYHVIAIPEPAGRMVSLLGKGELPDSISSLEDIDLVHSHKALCQLSKERKEAEEKAQGVFIKRKSIRANIDQCSESLKRMDSYFIKPSSIVERKQREHEERVNQFNELLYPGDTYEELWRALGVLENDTRKDVIELEASCNTLKHQYEEIESLRGELTALISKVEKSILARSTRHLDQETKDNVDERVQRIRIEDLYFDNKQKVEYQASKERLEEHIKDLKAELRLSTQIRNASKPGTKFTWKATAE